MKLELYIRYEMSSICVFLELPIEIINEIILLLDSNNFRIVCKYTKETCHKLLFRVTRSIYTKNILYIPNLNPEFSYSTGVENFSRLEWLGGKRQLRCMPNKYSITKDIYDEREVEIKMHFERDVGISVNNYGVIGIECTITIIWVRNQYKLSNFFKGALLLADKSTFERINVCRMGKYYKILMELLGRALDSIGRCGVSNLVEFR